ncbi:DUF4870 domain-containing protein [Mammaliicoccus vitulinus]|uniref:DUF4870 domain-containing protein n=1 Tax=Mammaliicoccus vitulinus TaxID=71237 RepID=UPI00195142E4|nr:DUF4870 domain-containing protein [Mammaliicoccus vitulinus]MBM6628977.1 DUF4870 domain-containing protein [Mammaliicoccus vitulinus]
MTNTEQNPFQHSTLDDDNAQLNENTNTSDDDRLFGMLIYLTSFFGSFFAPLIIWLIKRDNSPFIDKIGKDYLNFFISYTIWIFVSGLLCIILIGFILIPILSVLLFVFTIIGAIKAYKGETYLPPLSIQFIK